MLERSTPNRFRRRRSESRLDLRLIPSATLQMSGRKHASSSLGSGRGRCEPGLYDKLVKQLGSDAKRPQFSCSAGRFTGARREHGLKRMASRLLLQTAATARLPRWRTDSTQSHRRGRKLSPLVTYRGFSTQSVGLFVAISPLDHSNERKVGGGLRVMVSTLPIHRLPGHTNHSEEIQCPTPP